MDLKQTYNKIAEDFHEDHHDDNHWFKNADQFIAKLKPEAKILDVGCGTGLKAKYLLKKGLKVTGIDISDKMIEIAKKENPRGDFIVMDMKNVGKLPDLYDGIFAHAVFLHTPKQEIEKIIKILTKKLKENGYFYISLKEKGNKDEDIVRENDYGYEYERFFSYFTIEELKKYLENAKLDIVCIDKTTLPRYNWITIIAKKE